jgi:hypothetical protein
MNDELSKPQESASADTIAPGAQRLPFPPPATAPLQPPGGPTTTPRNFVTVVVAALGSVFLGVTLPVLLVCWHNSELNPKFQNISQYFILIGSLQLIATIFCGPGAVILSVLLLIYMSRRKNRYVTSHDLVTASMWRGALVSFLNFPGLLAGGLVSSDPVITWVRVILMFLVAGGSSGAWIGWQVYRQSHSGTPFLPRYRLSTLLLLVISWAVLLAIFAPSSKI